MTESAIFVGKIGHTRFAPRKHSFSYPIYMLYLDLAEIDGRPFGNSPLFSASRWAPARFRREDFFGDPAKPLDSEVRDLVETNTGTRPTGPIRLLANMRTFGYQFNPIAVYYCFADDGERLTNVVADVSNIPYGESHAYVFEATAGGTEVDGTAEKKMHVSPFLEMDYTYRIRTAAPSDELALFVSDSRDDIVEFSAALRLRRREPTAANLRRTLMRFPAIAIGTTTKIFWQALRMKLRGFRWYPHAKPIEDAAELRPSVAIPIRQNQNHEETRRRVPIN